MEFHLSAAAVFLFLALRILCYVRSWHSIFSAEMSALLPSELELSPFGAAMLTQFCWLPPRSLLLH